MTRLRVGLFAASQAIGAYAVQGSIFDRVVSALEGALQDAVDAQKTNDDEFKKTECQATELIDEANERIPKHTETIEQMTVRQKELRSENEALSGEERDLDDHVAEMKVALQDKTTIRGKENAKYVQDNGDYTTASNQLGLALQTLTDGTANLVQTAASVGKDINIFPGQVALLQTAAKTGTSGQVIGILTKLKEQFESNLLTIEAEETEAQKLFDGYKERTDKQIKAEDKQSQANKDQILDNQLELSGVQEKLKSNKKMLADMKEQLKTQSVLMAEHKEFHAQLTKESEGLKAAIQQAISLLTSNDAQNTMSKASDHMVAEPTFLQLGARPNMASFMAKAAAIRKHYQGKAAGEYAWNAIFTALDDMTASVEADQIQAEEKFTTCEMQLKQHHDEEKKLKAQKLKNTLDREAAESVIKNMQDAIKDAKDEISRSTEEIKDTTNDIREAEESASKETKEAQDASGLFKQAITFLKQYQSSKDLSAPESGSATYGTSTMSTGTERVVAIIEKVEADMIKEIDDLNTQTTQNISRWHEAIDNAKERIKSAKTTIGESTTKMADGQSQVAGAEVFLREADGGLAAEAAWWGPAPGNKLPAAGEDCIAFLGKPGLGESGGREADYQATSKEAGEGDYHKKTKANTDEFAGLSEMKSLIDGIRKDYLVAQPPGSAV